MSSPILANVANMEMQEWSRI